LADLSGYDHTSASGEHLDVLPAALAQQIEHVAEELNVPALIGAHRDSVRVLLQRGSDDLLDRAVVAKVNDLDAAHLEHAADDVDRGVVAIEQTGSGDEPDVVLRALSGHRGSGREIGHPKLQLSNG